MIVASEKSAPSWKEVLERAGGPALSKPLQEVMTGLENLGLAFRLDEDVLLFEPLRHLVPTSLSDRYTLQRCLNLYDAPTLKRICERLGIPSGSKPEIVAAIHDFLLGALPKVRLHAPLDEEETEVLNYLVAEGGYARSEER